MYSIIGDALDAGPATYLSRDQFGDAGQVVGDQIEQEVGSDSGDAAMLGLAHRAVLLAPAEDAFGHRPAGLRHAVALVPRGASVDGACCDALPTKRDRR
jgi:hypothetical protein